MGSGLALNQNFFVHVISALRDFFRHIFQMSPKGPLNFSLFCKKLDVQIIPKGPPFYIFWHYATYRRLPKKPKKVTENCLSMRVL